MSAAANAADHVDMSHLDVMAQMYSELNTKPESFGFPNGRFVLISQEEEDYKSMYIHFAVFSVYSPVLKAWMEANHNESQEGVPYKLLCSAEAMQCLMDLIYKQAQGAQLIPVLHECLYVCSELQMFSCMKVLSDKMKINVDQKLIKDSAVLVQWLFCAATFSLDDGLMEPKLLMQLKKLAGNDAEKKKGLQSELTKYMDKVGSERGAQLLMQFVPIKTLKWLNTPQTVSHIQHQSSQPIFNEWNDASNSARRSRSVQSRDTRHSDRRDGHYSSLSRHRYRTQNYSSDEHDEYDRDRKQSLSDDSLASGDHGYHSKNRHKQTKHKSSKSKRQPDEIPWRDRKNEKGAVLVVMAAITPQHAVYGQYYREINDFQIRLADQMRAHGDNVIIFCDPSIAGYFLQHLPSEVILQQALADINIGEYAPVVCDKQVWFQYRPLTGEYNKAHTRMLQERLSLVLRKFCGSNDMLMPNKSSIVLNGLDIADNDHDKVLISAKLFTDNTTLRANVRGQVERRFTSILGCTSLAILPESGIPGDSLANQAVFVGRNTVAISGHLDQDHYWAVHDLIVKAFGDELHVITLESQFEASIWHGFRSSCGLHINMVGTERNLYVPAFGEDRRNRGQSRTIDDEVIGDIASATKYNVVTVQMDNLICRLGLNLRSIVWVMFGPLADTLVDIAKHT